MLAFYYYKCGKMPDFHTKRYVMITKLNRYLYWCILTLLCTVALLIQQEDYTFSNISMVFLFTLATLTFVHVMIAVVFHVKNPDYFEYNEDIFYDVKWSWDWNLDKEILHLKPSCPKCQHDVYFTFDTLLNQTEFVCNHCDKQLANINSSSRNFVAESVRQSIIRKLKKQDSTF